MQKKHNKYIALTAFTVLSSISYFSQDVPKDISSSYFSQDVSKDDSSSLTDDESSSLPNDDVNNLFVSRSINYDSDLKDINSNLITDVSSISIIETVKKVLYTEDKDLSSSVSPYDSEILSIISIVNENQNLDKTIKKIIKINSSLLFLLQRNRIK